MINLDLVTKNFLDESKEDYVGLWSIVRRIRDANTDNSDVIATTLDLLRTLLDEQKIVAGNFQNGTNFNMWNISTNEIISKIAGEWKSLGRDPNIGEIVWFTSK
jgi:hypothetical protein